MGYYGIIIVDFFPRSRSDDFTCTFEVGINLIYVHKGLLG